MDTAAYVTLSRQTGLDREIRTVANNMANISTSGFRREGVVFAEMVQALRAEGGSVAMTAARARTTSEAQGPLRQNREALSSFMAVSISASSVRAWAIDERQATPGDTPEAISLAACTSSRVEAPSSSP